MLSWWSGLGTRLVSCLTSRLKAFVSLGGQTDMMGISAVPPSYSGEGIIKSKLRPRLLNLTQVNKLLDINQEQYLPPTTIVRNKLFTLSPFETKFSLTTAGNHSLIFLTRGSENRVSRKRLAFTVDSF